MAGKDWRLFVMELEGVRPATADEEEDFLREVAEVLVLQVEHQAMLADDVGSPNG